jgi:hypothetical protein
MLKRREVEILLKAGHPKWPVWREYPCALLSALQKKLRCFMSMMPPSERSGRSADPARLRISGKPVVKILEENRPTFSGEW